MLAKSRCDQRRQGQQAGEQPHPPAGVAADGAGIVTPVEEVFTRRVDAFFVGIAVGLTDENDTAGRADIRESRISSQFCGSAIRRRRR